jgi:hypothetical protein
MNRILRSAVVLVLLAAIAIPASATRIQRLTLDQVRDKADRIVIGEVLGVSTRLAGSGETVFTDYEVRVDERLRGFPQSVEVISFMGGYVDGVGVQIAGIPQLEVGGKYIFFLYNGNKVPMPTVGWGQGIFRIQEAEVDGLQKTVIISVDGETLEMTADRQLKRGRSAQIVNGALVTPGPSTERQAANRVALSATNADGSVAPAGTPRAAAAVDTARNMASLDDVRAFINKTLAATASKQQ